MLRRANEGDLSAILAILAQAKQYLAQQGIDQWQDGYPNETVMRGDIAQGTAYVYQLEGEVRGIATLVLTGEPTYCRIEQGAWTTREPYACIHRVAVAESARGLGIADAMMAALAAEARTLGMQSARIDTHSGNRAMLGMLSRNGYTACGVIYLESGAPRVALEMPL